MEGGADWARECAQGCCCDPGRVIACAWGLRAPSRVTGRAHHCLRVLCWRQSFGSDASCRCRCRCRCRCCLLREAVAMGRTSSCRGRIEAKPKSQHHNRCCHCRARPASSLPMPALAPWRGRRCLVRGWGHRPLHCWWQPRSRWGPWVDGGRESCEHAKRERKMGRERERERGREMEHLLHTVRWEGSEVMEVRPCATCTILRSDS